MTISSAASSFDRKAGNRSLTGVSCKGYTVLDGRKEYLSALSGTGKSFTFVAIVKPSSASANSVLLSIEDQNAALKTNYDGTGLEFFVYWR